MYVDLLSNFCIVFITSRVSAKLKKCRCWQRDILYSEHSNLRRP